MARQGNISLALAALGLAASLGACLAQSARPVPPRVGLSRVYPDTADGLRELLNNLLATARTADPGRVDALLVELEIPDSGRWFSSTLGPDAGPRDDDLYHRTLDENENDFEKRIEQMARQGGEFQVRNVNDAPRGAEPALLLSFRQRADLYFVSWKPKAGAADPLPHPYFVFADGKFRWDTLLDSKAPPSESSEAPPSGGASPQISDGNISRRPPNQPGERAAPPPAPPARQTPSVAVFQPLYTPSSPSAATSQQPSSAPAADTVYTPGQNGVGVPSCISCPSPTYPESARADRLQGTVVLRATIGVDGRASNITLVRTDELIFVEPAIAAVRDWRFKPANGPDGKPVPVVVPLEVVFRPPPSK